MTTIDTSAPRRLHEELNAVWGVPPGIGRLSAVNHNIVGRRFILTAFVFFTIGGILAMLVRAQLATPHSAFLNAELYNQIFTMHGTVMMFLFAIPMFEGLAMYLLPKMLGARDLAFPRLSAYGYWCYLFGGSILILALFFGVAPDGGWFMYTPLASRPYTPGINADVWLIGITFVEISALAAAVEIIVTVLKIRAPGMSLDRMPLFAWYLLVTAFMMLVGFPPLILGSILLELERAFDLPFFDPRRGGDPLLWQHLFWLFGHPEVYIIFLPAAGVISTVLPVFARREIVGYTWIVVSIIALGFLSLGLWVHHMFTVGIPHLALAFFSAASALVAVPTAVQIFAWIATLLTGRPQLRLPLLYILGFFFVFVLGGLTGVMLAMVPFDWQAHDTHFVVAHLHYVLVGGFIFPMLAAAYYWLPHFTGRVPVYSLGQVAFWLIFIGFNLTFFIMHLTGLLGMPRRIFTYPAEIGWTWPNLISSIGGFIMTIGFALFVVDVVMQFWYGRRVRGNVWRAGTLEWATSLPPPVYNFAAIPSVNSRAPLRDAPDLRKRLASGHGYLGFVRHRWLETLGVEMVTGRVDQIVLLPRSSFVPLWSAIATGVFFVAVLFKAYLLALAGAAATVVSLLLWTRGSGFTRDYGPLPIGNGEQALPHHETLSSPPWWAAVFAMAADAALFFSLLFGVLFLWVSAPNWPPPDLLTTGHGLSLAAAVALLMAAWASRRPLADNAATGIQRPQRWLLVAVGAQLTVIGALAVVASYAPDPTLHAYGAATFVLVIFVILHAGLGMLFALLAWWRCRRGYVSPARSFDLRLARLWQDYAAVTGLATLAFIYALPWVMR
jgi:cytochrome c oxidase subunit I+III